METARYLKRKIKVKLLSHTNGKLGTKQEDFIFIVFW